MQAGQDLIVQLLLAHLGYYQGLRDGLYGDKTNAALAAFQRDMELVPTGRLDSETWQHLAMACEIVAETEDALREAHEGQWPALPDALLEDFDDLCRACVEHGVVYGPGRGWVDEQRKLWVVTQGAFGLDSRRYATKRVGPAFVCSSFTYFAAMLILRQQRFFNGAMAGAQPPIWDILDGKHEVSRSTKSGPWLGLGPFFRQCPGDGSSQARRPRLTARDMDLLEVWERFSADPMSVPELMFGAWASSARGFFHHTAAIRCDREAGVIRFHDAGGYRSGGAFSGTLMDIGVIDSRSVAEAKQQTGWGRWWGVWSSEELAQELATQPRYGLGFEVELGKVTVAREA